MVLIVFNLIFSSFVININLVDRPEKIRQFFGGSVDLSGGKHETLILIHKLSSFFSFISIWSTTAVFIYSFRDPLKVQKIPIIILAFAIFYFFISYFLESFFSFFIFPFILYEPVLVSIILVMLMIFNKPLGGIIFGLAFFKISKQMSYQTNLKTYMILLGCGIILLFSANQTTSLVLTPYPPFGMATLIVLILGSYLILVGIYSSATLISKNNDLRRIIHKISRESKLLDIIGQAEMEKEITKVASSIKNELKEDQDEDSKFDLNDQELKSYIESTINELKKYNDDKNRSKKFL